MTSNSSALTPAALASVASRKTIKVQEKLKVAEAELHSANEVLVDAVPKRDTRDIKRAVARNIAAEEKVHQATEELEEVKQLLGDAQARQAEPPANPKDAGTGRTGEGARSLLGLLGRSVG